ncbi:MAG: MotA/TolQ/ExbB proton channel family protein, partial [Pseudomonadota bacterium]
MNTDTENNTADSLEASEWNALEQAFQLSGPVGVVLMVLLAVVIAILIVKVLQFLRCGVFFSSATRTSSRLVQQFSDGYGHEALNHRARNPAVSVVKYAINQLHRGTLHGEDLSQEVNRQLSGYARKIRTQHRTLELIGSLAPLLGLLGTVLGMIEAFRQMQMAGQNVDPSILSGGIWQALLTTAMGITVAIPAIAIHTWLESSAENHLSEIGSDLNRVMTVASLTRNSNES